mmetsp:Transcript_3331/g.9038  ORF Transcript_3331/g.9038 Transcript_3331/m.9038 type:complete len:105 (-) Transcript_3331:63-377(-)
MLFGFQKFAQFDYDTFRILLFSGSRNRLKNDLVFQKNFKTWTKTGKVFVNRKNIEGPLPNILQQALGFIIDWCFICQTCYACLSCSVSVWLCTIFYFNLSYPTN